MHVYICPAGKLRASASRTITVAISCKNNIHLHLKIKILIRRAFTAMPQVLLALPLCLICLYHIELMYPTTTCIKKTHLFWHLLLFVSRKQLLEPHHLSHRWHKPLPEHLVHSMSEKIIQHLNFLGINTETYHTTGFKTNQNPTKRGLPHSAIHSQA